MKGSQQYTNYHIITLFNILFCVFSRWWGICGSSQCCWKTGDTRYGPSMGLRTGSVSAFIKEVSHWGLLATTEQSCEHFWNTWTRVSVSYFPSLICVPTITCYSKPLLPNHLFCNTLYLIGTYFMAQSWVSTTWCSVSPLRSSILAFSWFMNLSWWAGP